MARWNFEKDVRQRFDELAANGWTDAAIAIGAGLNEHWVQKYRQGRNKSNTASRLQKIYDLYEEHYG